MQDHIRIDKRDNVAVALTDLAAGSVIATECGEVSLKEDIRRGHKFALADLAAGDEVIKYGFPIGRMTSDAKSGSHIHVHNLKTGLGDDLDYEYAPVKLEAIKPEIPEEDRYFFGYERADGRVGIRNELWIVPTVGCVNNIAKEIEKRCAHLAGEGVDAVVAFNHPYGCSQMGDDQENTREALAGLITHPNAAGVLVLGLGCENSGIEVLKEYMKDMDTSRVRFLKCQDAEDEVSEGVRIVNEMAEAARGMKRTKQGADKLVIGLKCGGSDGLSGITANPTVGKLSDIITGLGGSTILTEVPEMFGAETILMSRCENKEVFEKTVKLINDFKGYFRKHGQTIYENPSPGNKEGGISTLEDKALGCTQKSGSSKVMNVLPYAGRIKTKGLNLLSAPGNDLVASTALAVSGAQMVLFTTGRGTPFASVVPTVKIASNSPLSDKKKNWIDFDAGRLLDGISLDALGHELYSLVLKVAGGSKVKSEDGYREFAIFKTGVTL